MLRASRGRLPWRRILSGIGVVLVVGAGVLTPGAAWSAEGLQRVDAPGADMVPFDSSEPAVIGSGGLPTIFVRLDRPDGAGHVTTPIPNNAVRRFEAIAFNSADNFLYAVDFDLNMLLRIDSTGSFEDLFGLPHPSPGSWEGGTYTSATFGAGSDANILYLLPGYGLRRLTTVDVTTGQSAAVQLSQPVPGNDMVYKDGLLWQFNQDSAYRIDPSTGGVDVFDATALGLAVQASYRSYDAQWLYGNGNVGIAQGDHVYQISISGPDSEHPSFRLVDDAPAVIELTDGTSIAGSPVDVGLSQGGDETFTPGRSYEYTITLTNNGGGTSSGSRVEGTVPVGLLSPEVLTPGCTIAEGSLACAFGAMQAGATKTILVRGTAADDSTEDALRSTVTVVGNEADPVASNDDAVFAPKPVPAPALSLQASVDRTSVTGAGQGIVFSFPVTNTGNVEVRDVSVSSGGKV
ncbi:hypothetical protein ABE10_00430, partial [Bacillus toyonensis]|nr:hypothetical protein [Bacillus toyonensis]